MGLKALVIRWVEEWAERELDAKVEARLQAWAGAELKEQTGAHFDAKFRKQYDALPKADLKELLDAYFDARADDFIENKFDNRFFTWADLWADKHLTPRLDTHFDGRLNGQLDHLVQARVANRIDDRIDRRIQQWLNATRTQTPEVVLPTAPDLPAAEHAKDTAPSPGPAETPLADTLVTAAELAELLRAAGLKARRVRALLKGHEAVKGRTYRYRLGDAAARILLRQRRKGRGGGSGRRKPMR
ncbi:hypothetical protein Nocox_41225 [Nonomuraea coxensis DSM 45129]|uniref:Uncharacterized protein n=1 Tax=Nonomuraea coxensis DSM 45129 TaxID=1122611 RepID=A0ABX8UDH9_9ACTN|nr:hypothetical protein [Nonomuraea coxensis]QYC45788.1 hypothetical protein Nocox_41225 [Nonomuraea coxensis DSM 45129]